MSDDLFSQFFRLFESSGPVNLKLASEVAHHLVGDAQPVDPWTAEEFREITRLAEYRIEAVAPFPVSPAGDVLPVDARGWVDRNLEPLSYLAKPFGGILRIEGAPEAALLAGLAPAMIGIQLGTLVGSLGTWVMAGFDAGVPTAGEAPITYVVPAIDSFAERHGFDPREVRLWIALNETAHRALFRVPGTTEHLVTLMQDYADAISIGPDKLASLLGGFSPEQTAQPPDMDQMAALFDTPEGRVAHAELAAYLGVTGGYRRILVERAADTLLPALATLDAARDGERDLGDAAGASALTATFVESSDLAAGEEFCREVERRFGRQALEGIWADSRFPIADEISDPVAWAARVLLDDLD